VLPCFAFIYSSFHHDFKCLFIFLLLNFSQINTYSLKQMFANLDSFGQELMNENIPASFHFISFHFISLKCYIFSSCHDSW
jgi:hypothetical protein